MVTDARRARVRASVPRYRVMETRSVADDHSQLVEWAAHGLQTRLVSSSLKQQAVKTLMTMTKAPEPSDLMAVHRDSLRQQQLLLDRDCC